MADTARNKIMRHRREGLMHLLKGAAHYGQVVKNLEAMQALADKDAMTDGERDKFSALSALVDREWKIVDRLLPKQMPELPGDELEQEESEVARQRVERLIGERVARVRGNNVTPLKR